MKVIAECGVNWRNFDEAMLMIKKAKEAGCWAAKFQLFKPSNLADAHKELPEHLYLTKGQAEFLFDYGKDAGINVFFTPMFEEAIDWCEAIGVNFYKVRHADNKNNKLIRKMLFTPYKKLIFLSSNDGTYQYHLDRVRVLLCIPEYPADYNEYIKKASFGYSGFSDHTKGLKLLKYAKDLNYEYFEKHVKLDDDCIEAKWSVTFEQLAEVLNT